MITRSRGKKEQVINEPAEVPFKMNAEGELQLTEELAEALRHRELVWARIPPRSRKLLLPFLTVQSACTGHGGGSGAGEGAGSP